MAAFVCASCVLTPRRVHTDAQDMTDPNTYTQSTPDLVGSLSRRRVYLPGENGRRKHRADSRSPFPAYIARSLFLFHVVNFLWGHEHWPMIMRGSHPASPWGCRVNIFGGLSDEALRRRRRRALLVPSPSVNTSGSPHCACQAWADGGHVRFGFPGAMQIPEKEGGGTATAAPRRAALCGGRPDQTSHLPLLGRGWMP